MQTAKQAVQLVVEGTHLVSKRVLGMMLEIVKTANEEKHLVNKITLTTDTLKHPTKNTDVVGMCSISKGEVSISLKNIVDEMVELFNSETDKEDASHFLSFRGEYILQLLLVFGHEVGHLLKAENEGLAAYRLMSEAKREEMADLAADNAMMHMLENFNIEPVAVAEEPYLFARLQEAMIRFQHAPWVYRERMMAAKGLMFDNGERQFTTLREFAEHRWQDKCDWKQATYPVRVEFNSNEKGESKVYEQDYADAGDEGVLAVMDEGVEIQGLDEGNGYYEAPDADGGPVYSEAPPMAPAPVINTAVAVEAPVVPTAGASFVPPHIAAAKQAGASGQAVASGQQQVNKEPKMYPPNAHDQARILEFMMAVYGRLYAHMFTHCGWTGTAGGTDWHFSNPTAVVAKPVSIADLIHAYGMPDVVMEYNTHGADGKKLYAKNGTAEKCNGMIRGEIFSTSKLPGYTLYINVHGMALKRVLTPQNTAKESQPGMRAREGHCIAYIIKGDDGVGEHDKWIGRFEDGTWYPSKK